MNVSSSLCVVLVYQLQFSTQAPLTYLAFIVRRPLVATVITVEAKKLISFILKPERVITSAFV